MKIINISFLVLLHILLASCGESAENKYTQNDEGETLQQNLENQRTYQILFLGNSYTASNNLPALISDIASKKNIQIQTQAITPGGFRLIGHSREQSTLDMIASKPWDFVVLQDQSLVPGWKEEDLIELSLPSVQLLADAIKQNNNETKIVYFMTWGRQHGDSNYCGYYSLVCTFEGHTQALEDGYELYFNYTGDLIAKVGIAWQSIVNDQNAEFDVNNLWSSDGSHPSIYGSYLAANVIFLTMFGSETTGIDGISQLSDSHSNYIQSMASLHYQNQH